LKCNTTFRLRANRIRAGLETACPNCQRVIVFESGSDDANIRKALSTARKLRLALS
jgi:hypothetical protein